ncbi:MAG: BlaI/MecI/CopY family transcriptional regulator [Lishizhenia sp.]
MDRLTPAEEKVMLKLWHLNEASVKDIVLLYKEPKPAYNTVSTIVRILERKAFIKHKKKGRGFIYLPKISKAEYKDYLTDFLIYNYFDQDKNELVSFLNKKQDLSLLL